MGRGDAEQHLRRPVGRTAPLLPVLQGVYTDSEQRRKFAPLSAAAATLYSDYEVARRLPRSALAADAQVVRPRFSRMISGPVPQFWTQTSSVQSPSRHASTGSGRIGHLEQAIMG